MRLAIIGLILMGVLAAVATAVLLVALKVPAKEVGPVEEGPKTVAIFVAAKDLSIRTAVQSGDLVKASVREDLVPQNAILDETQAIGKELVTSMLKGQPLSTTLLMTPPPINERIPPGWRMFSAPITASTGIEKWLYPDCDVDIIALLELPSVTGQGPNTKVAKTLMTNVRVLGVGENTVLTAGNADEPPPPPGKMLTFLIRPEHVEYLTLASSLGQLSVTLRSKGVDDEFVSDGATLTEFALSLSNQAERLLNSNQSSETEERLSRVEELLLKLAEQERVAAQAPPDAAPPSTTETWETVIIRRNKQESKTFDLADEDKEADDDVPEDGVIARDGEADPRSSK